jgi:adenosylmethionine-8-amino-7-oxononanoate aminotransferase
LLPRIVAGEGIHLIDEHGRRLLDACSGPFLTALGQGNERVLRAMVAQGRALTYSYSRTTRHDANARLSERLASLAGLGFERAHITSGGSEAVEMALKFLRAHAVATGNSQRSHVISLMPGYHGATFQTIGLNGDVNVQSLWGDMTVYSEKVPAPLTFRAASPEAAASISLTALEAAIDRIGGERVLAFVMEPVGGQATGANIAHTSFAHGVRKICDQHGVRLVFDECVCAFRTGYFLAAHAQPDALPDVVVLAKGLGAGYAPLGAMLVSAALVEELAATSGFVVSHSYDANPIACAAGAAVLDEIVERDLIQRAARAGDYLRDGLEDIASESPLIGDVRGRGLLLAIELVVNKDTAEKFPAEVDPGAVVLRHGLDHGLLLYSRRQNGGRFGDWLMVAPALVVNDDDCNELLSGLRAAVAAAGEELLALR